MKLSRRNILAYLGGGVICSTALVSRAGLRYPSLQFSPESASTRSSDADGSALQVEASGAIFQQREHARFQFRAFVPEPEIRVHGGEGGGWQVHAHNIHPEAKLISSPKENVTETRNNLTRIVSGRVEEARMTWRFPRSERYRFAAIGDTGGGMELRWVLKRAHALGADFVLHLGDFNYGSGEYLSSVDAFDNALIPTFVTIGNHEFYDGSRSVHDLFRQYIGPRNAVFELGNVLFINIDTAAGFIPRDSGTRGEFLRSLEPSKGTKDIVVFTHKPLADPRAGKSHRVSALEYGFLHREFKRVGVNAILAGHIHIKEDFDDRGIRTIVSGQGLAHADLIVDGPVAEILLGDVTPESNTVEYHWAPMEMPFEMHCSPRAWEVLVAIDKPGVLRQLKEICAKNQSVLPAIISLE